jgi:hypothetical protein
MRKPANEVDLLYLFFDRDVTPMTHYFLKKIQPDGRGSKRTNYCAGPWELDVLQHTLRDSGSVCGIGDCVLHPAGEDTNWVAETKTGRKRATIGDKEPSS